VRGFTLVELMIVLAIVAVILTIALPVYSDYAIRTKVTKAIGVAEGAKTAVSKTCTEYPKMRAITPENVQYKFSVQSKYVQNILISGSCTSPEIAIRTQNTGASPDPVIILEGYLENGEIRFRCNTTGSGIHAPPECRHFRG
jgi:prepilin-type N-terminal cleavage/methylation domain-containing protein